MIATDRYCTFHSICVVQIQTNVVIQAEIPHMVCGISCFLRVQDSLFFLTGEIQVTPPPWFQGCFQDMRLQTAPLPLLLLTAALSRISSCLCQFIPNHSSFIFIPPVLFVLPSSASCFHIHRISIASCSVQPTQKYCCYTQRHASCIRHPWNCLLCEII